MNWKNRGLIEEGHRCSQRGPPNIYPLRSMSAAQADFGFRGVVDRRSLHLSGAGPDLPKAMPFNLKAYLRRALSWVGRVMSMDIMS
jgi:hypothetical protein